MSPFTTHLTQRSDLTLSLRSSKPVNRLTRNLSERRLT